MKKKGGLGGPRDPRHGTPSGYRYWGCRCDVCREGNSVRDRETRESVTVTEHNRRGYDLGCRCDVCRDAKVAEDRRRRHESKEWKQKNGTTVLSSRKVTFAELA